MSQHKKECIEMAPRGRPKGSGKVIDKEELRKLCAGIGGLTLEEVGSYFNLDRRTIRRHADKDPEIQEIIELGRDQTTLSIRRRQFQLLAMDNSAAVTMAIWLGKQYLGQRDNYEIEVSATPIQIQLMNPYAVNPEDDLIEDLIPESVPAPVLVMNDA